ncbi:unnamed protein product [Penicillium roqueforti FM164]|uniref:Genomic scaffold, ProqFM164S02 n=1 Tax=Penicillium roqueforti (strain FM164) TaxID=1365484 RepID=W6Q952_PENRF|nr:unnamed protein product [Penicillium roqueforti FM164]
MAIFPSFKNDASPGEIHDIVMNILQTFVSSILALTLLNFFSEAFRLLRAALGLMGYAIF